MQQKRRTEGHTFWTIPLPQREERLREVAHSRRVCLSQAQWQHKSIVSLPHFLGKTPPLWTTPLPQREEGLGEVANSGWVCLSQAQWQHKSIVSFTLFGENSIPVDNSSATERRKTKRGGQ